MADHTKIEWTEATWNPITGCSVHSPGCTNCYAMKLAGTRLRNHPSRMGLTQDSKAGPVWTGEVRFNEEWLAQPLTWKRPRMIFVCAHGDLFHESVPDEWIDRVFAVMALAPQHTFQVLTKRSDRMREWFTGEWQVRLIPHLRELQVRPVGSGVILETRNGTLPNVWLGVSVEDRTRMLDRAADLKATPAAVRWWSAEPLLGDLGEILPELMPDWIVCGGESGAGARPMHPDWARSLRDQCAEANVPFFFKQWGEWGPDTGPDAGRDRIMDGAGPCAVRVGDQWKTFDNGFQPGLDLCSGHGEWVYRLGKRTNGRLLDGIEHHGFPEPRHA